MNTRTLLDGCAQSLDEMIHLAEQFYNNEIAALAHPRNMDYLQSVSFEIEQAKIFRKKIAVYDAEKPAESALSVVKNWDAKHRGRYVTLDAVHQELADDIQQYAEEYADKRCAACAEFLPDNGPETEVQK
jgi:hypothetical protein